MATDTKIEWTDHTFNPWIGCTKVSPGCLNCYAKTRDDRRMLGPVSHWGSNAPRHITSASYWRDPLKWAKQAKAEGRRHKVFTASQADIFDIEAPVMQRRLLWNLIGDTCEWLDWQIVTKRPQNIPGVIDEDNLNDGFFELTKSWLITSTEDQARVNQRVPLILRIPAAVHGISAEPLLGPLDLFKLRSRCVCQGHDEISDDCPGELQLIDSLDWVIVGGESGPGARPMQLNWASSLVQQCRDAGVACFVKQLGTRHPNPGDPKGADMLWWPEHLRVRQFPAVRP